MIFSVFVLLISLAIVFFIAGFIIDIPLLSVIGAVFFFGLGIFMLNTDIQVQTGEAINNTVVNGTITHQDVQKVYSDYDFGGVGGTSFGWLLMILGVLLFIITLTTL